jgi:hypothetical protein
MTRKHLMTAKQPLSHEGFMEVPWWSSCLVLGAAAAAAVAAAAAAAAVCTCVGLDVQSAPSLR